MHGSCATYTILNVYYSGLEPLTEQVCYSQCVWLWCFQLEKILCYRISCFLFKGGKVYGCNACNTNTDQYCKFMNCLNSRIGQIHYFSFYSRYFSQKFKICGWFLKPIGKFGRIRPKWTALPWIILSYLTFSCPALCSRFRKFNNLAWL
jgi:hypothetical protein